MTVARRPEETQNAVGTGEAGQAASNPPGALVVGKALLIVRDIVDALEDAGILDADGSFDVSVIAEDAKAIALVEEVLVKHGVEVPERVDQIIRALPAFLQILEASGALLAPRLAPPQIAPPPPANDSAPPTGDA